MQHCVTGGNSHSQCTPVRRNVFKVLARKHHCGSSFTLHCASQQNDPAFQVIHFKELMKTKQDDKVQQDIKEATDVVIQQLRLHVSCSVTCVSCDVCHSCPCATDELLCVLTVMLFFLRKFAAFSQCSGVIHACVITLQAYHVRQLCEYHKAAEWHTNVPCCSIAYTCST